MTTQLDTVLGDIKDALNLSPSQALIRLVNYNGIGIFRDFAERSSPTTQCINTIEAFKPGTICYICGMPIVPASHRSADCEHILPVYHAALLLGLYNTKDHLKDDPNKEYNQKIFNLEYKWSHSCCNKIKSNMSFLDYKNGLTREFNNQEFVPHRENIKTVLRRIYDNSSNRDDCTNLQAELQKTFSTKTVFVTERTTSIVKKIMDPIVVHLNEEKNRLSENGTAPGFYYLTLMGNLNAVIDREKLGEDTPVSVYTPVKATQLIKGKTHEYTKQINKKIIELLKTKIPGVSEKVISNPPPADFDNMLQVILTRVTPRALSKKIVDHLIEYNILIDLEYTLNQNSKFITKIGSTKIDSTSLRVSPRYQNIYNNMAEAINSYTKALDDLIDQKITFLSDISVGVGIPKDAYNVLNDLDNKRRTLGTVVEKIVLPDEAKKLELTNGVQVNNVLKSLTDVLPIILQHDQEVQSGRYYRYTVTRGQPLRLWVPTPALSDDDGMLSDDKNIWDGPTPKAPDTGWGFFGGMKIKKKTKKVLKKKKKKTQKKKKTK
jgi:hypothetical protein